MRQLRAAGTAGHCPHPAAPTPRNIHSCSHIPVCSPGSPWVRVWSRTTQSQRRRSVCSLRTCRDRQRCSEQPAVLRRPADTAPTPHLLLPPPTSHPQLESSAQTLTRKLAVLMAPRSFCPLWGRQSCAAPSLSPTAHRVVGLQDAAGTRPTAAGAPSAATCLGGELLRAPTARSCAPTYSGEGDWSKSLQSTETPMGRAGPSGQHSRPSLAQHGAGRTHGQCSAGRTHACPAAVPQHRALGAHRLHQVQPRLRAAPRTARPAAVPAHRGSSEEVLCLQDCASASSLPCTQCHLTAPRLPGHLPPTPAAAQHGCSQLPLPWPGPALSAAKRAAKPLIQPSASSSTAEPQLCARSQLPRCLWLQEPSQQRRGRSSGTREQAAACSRMHSAQQNAAALPRGRQQGLAHCPAGVGRKAGETRIYRQQNEQRS